MFSSILQRFRQRIRTRQFVMTLHGLDEMETEGFTVLDIEHVILTGEIIERQKDENTGEWKYLVRGLALSQAEVIVVAKLSPTSKLVIITVYAE